MLTKEAFGIVPCSWARTLPEIKTPLVSEKLTGRQLEVLTLMAQGLNNIEISKTLYISNRTVDVHRTNICLALSVDTRIQAVLAAINDETIRLEEITADLDIKSVERLSPAELNILRKIDQEQGRVSTNEDLALLFSISERTIETHFGNIYSKTLAKNRIQAVLMYRAAKKLGIVNDNTY